VKIVLDVPEDLARELRQDAQRNGRETPEHLVHLMRLALLVERLPLAELGRSADVIRALLDARNRAVLGTSAAVIQTDLGTGLPVILSPLDAPIHVMSLKEVLAFEQSVLDEEDHQRAGLSL
jgi:hypothetical protein